MYTSNGKPKLCWCRSIFAITGNTIDVSGAILLRTWRKTQYTIQELWDNQRCDLLLTSTGVTVNCDIIQSPFSLKKTFRHIFNIWLSHVNPKFFYFLVKIADFFAISLIKNKCLDSFERYFNKKNHS
jgi:hypothetical protein